MRILLFVLISVCIYQSNSAQPAETFLLSKPQEGEGVWAFLRRHNLNPASETERFRQINEGRFDSNGDLYLHKEYLIPVLSNEWTDPLFGKENQNLKIIDNELKDAVFFLVSGHGGPDPGAIGQYGGHQLYEDEYAYDITLRLAKNLMEKSATVHVIVQDSVNGIRSGAYLVPDQHETVLSQVIPLDQLTRLKQRATVINQLAKEVNADYQRCIEIHLDSRSQNKQLDVFFYHHENSPKGKEMALTISQTFEANYRKHQPRRGFSGTVTHRNLYMLKNTNPVAVFIELGNIRNFRDQQRFVVESNRQALANWLTAGIVKDFQNQKR
jgi:N-acetylmuramoyl-L-alanine amidase